VLSRASRALRPLLIAASEELSACGGREIAGLHDFYKELKLWYFIRYDVLLPWARAGALHEAIRASGSFDGVSGDEAIAS
jgi:hypothetical protein